MDENKLPTHRNLLLFEIFQISLSNCVIKEGAHFPRVGGVTNLSPVKGGIGGQQLLKIFKTK